MVCYFWPGFEFGFRPIGILEFWKAARFVLTGKFFGWFVSTHRESNFTSFVSYANLLLEKEGIQSNPGSGTAFCTVKRDYRNPHKTSVTSKHRLWRTVQASLLLFSRPEVWINKVTVPTPKKVARSWIWWTSQLIPCYDISGLLPLLRIRIRLFTLMRIRTQSYTNLQLPVLALILRGSIMSLHASIWTSTSPGWASIIHLQSS